MVALLVVTLPVVRRAVAVELPAPGQFRAVPVVRGQRGALVDAAGEDHAGLRTVEVGGGGEQPPFAVSPGVTPVGRGAAGGLEGHGVHHLAALAVEH